MKLFVYLYTRQRLNYAPLTTAGAGARPNEKYTGAHYNCPEQQLLHHAKTFVTCTCSLCWLHVILFRPLLGRNGWCLRQCDVQRIAGNRWLS